MHKAFNPPNGLHYGQSGLQNAHIVPSAAFINDVHVLAGNTLDDEANVNPSSDDRHVLLPREHTNVVAILRVKTPPLI